MHNYNNLQIWQSGMDLAQAIYQTCDNLPNHEKYGLISQMQRAAVSIPSNIAEGAGRPTNKDFSHFIGIAIGSAFEVETQLQIAKKRKYLLDDVFNEVVSELQSEEKQINTFISKLK